jgi:hypothetical protein
MKDRNELKKDLSKFDNLEQMLNYLNDNFDLSQKLNLIQKPIIIEGLIKANELIRPKLR